MRLEEIKEKIGELESDKEILYFFDNRTEYEDLALHNMRLLEERNMTTQRDLLTDEERLLEVMKKGTEKVEKTKSLSNII